MSGKKAIPTKQELRKYFGVIGITKPKRASTYYSLEKKRKEGIKRYRNRLWRDLSEDEKAPFVELEQLDNTRYEKEISEFNDYLLVKDEIEEDVVNERRKEEEIKKLQDDIRKSEILSSSAKNQNPHLDFGRALEKWIYGAPPNKDIGTIVINNNVPGSIGHIGSLTMIPPTRDAALARLNDADNVWFPDYSGYVRGNVTQQNMSARPQNVISVTDVESEFEDFEEQRQIDLMELYGQANNQKANEVDKRKVIVIDDTPKLSLTELPKVTQSNSELIKSTEDVSEELQCSICMDRKRNTVNVPCGHTYSCILCVVSEATLLKKPESKLLCNKCRAPIDKVLEVFL